MKSPFYTADGERIFDEAAEYTHQRDQFEARIKKLPEGHVLEAGFKLGQKKRTQEESRVSDRPGNQA